MNISLLNINYLFTTNTTDFFNIRKKKNKSLYKYNTKHMPRFFLTRIFIKYRAFVKQRSVGTVF